MQFSMKLEAKGPFTQVSPSEAHVYDSELDDVSLLIADICEALESTGRIKFIVTGFDPKPWPMDVETDLSVVLLQLPDALRRLEQHQSFTIDFYEQGTERRLEFRDKGDKIEVECFSGDLHWEPDPRILMADRKQLEADLRGLAHSFLRLASEVCPQLSEHLWIRKWRNMALNS